jgi:hypothetical protein
VAFIPRSIDIVRKQHFAQLGNRQECGFPDRVVSDIRGFVFVCYRGYDLFSLVGAASY